MIKTGWMLFSENAFQRRCRRRRHLDRKNRRLASLPSNHFESEVITLTAKNTGMGEDERKLPREFLAFFLRSEHAFMYKHARAYETWFPCC